MKDLDDRTGIKIMNIGIKILFLPDILTYKSSKKYVRVIGCLSCLVFMFISAWIAVPIMTIGFLIDVYDRI